MQSHQDHNPKDPNSLWLFPLLKETFDSALAVRDVGKKVLESTTEELKKIEKFLESVIKIAEEMSDKAELNCHNSDDTDLKDFLAYLKDSVAKFQFCTQVLSKSESSNKEILISVRDLLLSLPLLLESVKTLDLAAFTSYLPEDIESLQRMVTENVAEYVSRFITSQDSTVFLNVIDKVKSDMLITDKDSIQEFAKKSEFEQNVVLSVLDEMNNVLRAIAVFIDWYEIKYSLGEGSIFNKIKFSLPFNPTMNEQSLAHWCELFQDAYEKRMKVAQYDITTEMYPYLASKIQQRKQQLDECWKKYRETKAIGIESVRIWQFAIKDCVAALDKKIIEVSGSAYFPGRRQAKKDALDVFKTALQDKQDPNAAFNSLSEDQKKLITQDTQDEIKRILGLADKQISHLNYKSQMEICRIQAKVGEIVLLPLNMEISPKDLEDLSKQYHKRPLLFKNKNGQVYLYGCQVKNKNKALFNATLPVTTWGLIQLDSDIILNIAFPENRAEVRDRSNLDPAIYREIVTKKLHTYATASIVDPGKKEEKVVDHHAPANPLARNDILKTAISHAISTLVDNCHHFMGAYSGKKDISSLGTSSVLLTIQALIQKMESTLLSVMDADTFNQYFSEKSEPVLLEAKATSWIEELGESFRSVKRLFSQLNKLQKELRASTHGCDFIVVKSLSAIEDLSRLPGISKSAYILCGDTLVFGDMVKNRMTLYQLNEEKLIQLHRRFYNQQNDININSSESSKCIIEKMSDEQLEAIYDMTEKRSYEEFSKRKKKETPQDNLAKTINVATEFAQIADDISRAAVQLAGNPFISDNYSTLVSFPTIAREHIADAKNHHWYQFIENHGSRLLTELLSGNKFTSITQEIDDFYPRIVKDHPQDASTIKKVSKALKQLKEIAHDADIKFAEEATKKDILSFLKSHWGPIFSVLPNLAQITASLRILPSEIVLKMIQELNLKLRDFVLFADKIEMAYHLKEGIITKSIPVGSKSLYEFAAELHGILNEHGYQFKPEECFPYKKAIFLQRDNLKKTLQEELQKLQEQLHQAEENEYNTIKRLKSAVHLSPIKLETDEIWRTETCDQLLQLCDIRKIESQLTTAMQITLKKNVIPILLAEQRRVTVKLYNLHHKLPKKQPLTEEMTQLNQKKNSITATLDGLVRLVNSIPVDTIEDNILQKLNQIIKEYHEVESRIHQLSLDQQCHKAIEMWEQLHASRAANLRDDKAKSNKLSEQIAIIETFSEEYKLARARLKQLKNQYKNKESNLQLLSRRLTVIPVDIKQTDIRITNIHFKKVIKQIDIRLASLRKNRETKFLLFNQARRTDLEHRILGLSELRARYIKNGYTIDMAFNETCAKHEAYHCALMAYDYSFIKELKSTDKEIPDAERGNVIIDYLSKPTTPANEAKNHVDLITSRLSELEEKSTSIFNVTQTNRLKIDLLTSLHKHLETMPLADAIQRIRHDQPKIFYLLFEGRTGVVLNDLRLSTLKKEDMMDAIKAEIARLKIEIQKSSVILFFKGTSKATLQARIDALKQLKNSTKNSDLNLSSLDQGIQKTLQIYEPDLWKDLQKWNQLTSNVSLRH